jgi:hypothetical protein
MVALGGVVGRPKTFRDIDPEAVAYYRPSVRILVEAVGIAFARESCEADDPDRLEMVALRRGQQANERGSLHGAGVVAYGPTLIAWLPLGPDGGAHAADCHECDA